DRSIQAWNGNHALVRAKPPFTAQRIEAPATAVFVPPPCCENLGLIMTFMGRCVYRKSVPRCAHTKASPGASFATSASVTAPSALMALLRCLSHWGDVIL